VKREVLENPVVVRLLLVLLLVAVVSPLYLIPVAAQSDSPQNSATPAAAAPAAAPKDEIKANKEDSARAKDDVKKDTPGTVLRPSGLHMDVDLALVNDAAVEHLGKAGEFGDIFHGYFGVAQKLGGASRGDEFDVEMGEFAGEVDHTGLIGD
jgi:hypothetical protein